jgi:phytoene dehydrogenase-like protein
MSQPEYDAIVIGAGPNGLAAAITMAQAGRSVLVLEARETIGGGTRTAELTLPGFRHDICSAIHPLGVGSPFFRSLPLSDFGLKWIYPPAALAHPLDDDTAVLLKTSIEETAAGLGEDGRAYQRLMGPLTAGWEAILEDILGPYPFPPRHPVLLARFGLSAIRPAASLARSRFRGTRARAVFAGLAGHSILPLEKIATTAFGLVLGMLAHGVGWPIPAGGSQAIADSLAAYLRSLGGEIQTGFEVKSLADITQARAVLCDVTPRQLIRLAGERMPPGYRRQMERFRYGPGIFKVDYALAGPVPWRAPECARAGTVHIGGTLEEIAAAERAVWRGEHPEKPYVLFAQQSLFDSSRAPANKHTAWAYCHVPNGSTADMAGRIEAQIERFAPGFKDLILAQHTFNARDMEAYNANYIGGDINGGSQDLAQLFTRPAARIDPYATPMEGVYLCSSSTPPGGGVHGMCGYHAARSALRRMEARG